MVQEKLGKIKSLIDLVKFYSGRAFKCNFFLLTYLYQLDLEGIIYKN